MGETNSFIEEKLDGSRVVTKLPQVAKAQDEDRDPQFLQFMRKYQPVIILLSAFLIMIGASMTRTAHGAPNVDSLNSQIEKLSETI